MDTEKNPHYNPEAFGYTPVGTVNWTDEAYQFSFTEVWTDASSTLVWGSTAGCSCPMPFEYHTENDYFRGTKFDLAAYLAKRLQDVLTDEYSSSSLKNRATEQTTDLIEKLMLGEYK